MNRKILVLVFLFVPFLVNAQVELSGYLQTGVNYVKNDSKESFSFQAKRLRLISNGKVGENVSFRLQIEGFSGINGATNKNGQKVLHIMDAFATYKFAPEFKVRAGQFYTPMGYENYNISPAVLETVDFSNIVYQIVCRNPYEYNFVEYGRDLGVMLIGDVFDSGEGFSYLHYDFAVTNGAQQLKDDSNLMKDIYASINVRPLKHLSIKGTYNYGGYTAKDASGNLITDDAKMSRMVAGAWYNNPEGIDIRGEYGMLKSHDDKAPKFDQAGAYVLLGYHLDKFLPVVRWDMYQDNENEASTRNYNRILAGLTYSPINKLRIQLNYGYTMYEKKVSDAIGYDNSSQVQLMAIYKF